MPTPKYQTTDRDVAIFFDLLWFRYLTQSQIYYAHFHGTKSPRTCQRRMKILVEMGLVKSQKNPAPLSDNPQATSNDLVFYLSKQGFRYLTDYREIPEGLRPPEKEVRPYHFPHRMENNWFAFYLQRACLESDIETGHFYTDNHKVIVDGRMQSRITTNFDGVELEPDAAFCIERNDKKHLCLLEIDRGNNTLADKFPNYLHVMRSPNFYKKYSQLFGAEFKNFRLLVVTKTDQIIKNSQEAINYGEMVHFTTFERLHKSNLLFDPIWKSGRDLKSLAKRV